MNYNKETDFITELKQGKPKALDYFFTKYRPWLVVTAYSILQNKVEAEEIVQEFFIDFWQAKRFNNLTLSSVKELKNYLYICIKNKCLNLISKNKTRMARWQQLLLPADYVLPDLPIENEELKLELNKAINQLSKRQSEVFVLGYLDGKSRKEIAGDLGIAEESVKKHMAMALQSLRIYLKKIELH